MRPSEYLENADLSEVDQVDQGQASLRNETTGGYQSAPLVRSNQDDLAHRLSVLQSQMRQLQERQQHIESDMPPLYNTHQTDVSA